MAGLPNGREPGTDGDKRGRAFLKIRIKLAILQFSRQKWVRVTAVALTIPAAALSIATAYYYVSFAHLIDARLHGARQRVLPKVFARPLELRRGQALTDRQLVDQLNDLGYAQRADADPQVPRRPATRTTPRRRRRDGEAPSRARALHWPRHRIPRFGRQATRRQSVIAPTGARPGQRSSHAPRSVHGQRRRRPCSRSRGSSRSR